MTPSKRNFIKLVREAHNRFIYVTDTEQYGEVEDWRIPVLGEDGFLRGDCDDFACYIFDRGRAAGFDMRVVTCMVPTRRGEWGGHAVAYCDNLNLIADNMHSAIYPPGFLVNVRWRRMSGVNNLAKRHWRKARLVS